MSHLCEDCVYAKVVEYKCVHYGYVYPSYCECDKFKKKADEYRWHDLTKDPGDLPMIDKDEKVKVLVCYQHFCDNEPCYDLDIFGWFKIVQDGEWYCNGFRVIAWKEIEPFEVEE